MPDSNTTGTRRSYKCSFCGKTQDQVDRLIAGPGAVYICNECVTLCNEIINETPGDKPTMAGRRERQAPTPTPCPECKAERILAEAGNTMILELPGTKLPGITGGITRLWALVCPNCGYTTFYAKAPGKLTK